MATALLATAPVGAEAQQPFPARDRGEPSLFSATVFTGVATPGQWVSGAGLRVRVSRIRFEPAVTHGRAGNYDSLTGWATVSLLLMETPGLDSYVGGGVAYYRERSDAAGLTQTRSIVAPGFLAGVETDVLGVGLFAEARLLDGEYAGDSGIGATDVGSTSFVAGIWLPF